MVSLEREGQCFVEKQKLENLLQCMLGSISPNFVRQVKSHQRTSAQNSPFSFTNSETAEFCQITVLNFSNILCLLPNAICQKSFSHLACKKVMQKCW
jgi:hypothetical protein